MLDWLTDSGCGYLLGVALIPGVGLLLLYRGIWGDRSKGRTRCPKCWYDMRGTVPRLECPECGHDARQERRLHKHHRRWRRVTIGALLVLVSAYPLAIVGGWWRPDPEKDRDSMACRSAPIRSCALLRACRLPFG
jgi:hypothetical protein